MFNFKNKTLAIAICAAFCLSACGDNVNAPQNAVINKELTQRNVQAELEYKVAKMLEENVTQKLMGNDNTLKIQQYVIDTFSANNIRMEPTLENYKWYAERELIPPFLPKKTKEESDLLQKEMRKNQAFFTEVFINENGEPNKKTLEIVKKLFFRDDGSFLLNDTSVENALFLLVAFDTFMLSAFPFMYYTTDKNGNIDENIYMPDRLNKHLDGFGSLITFFVKEFIFDKKTQNKNFFQDMKSFQNLSKSQKK